jgi:DNA-binding CsgD family transcriptional regulator
MKLDILYRGPLASCNYGCEYCPFAKRKDTREERRLNARGPRPESGVERFDLTAREVEMANLASDGLTNRDIGLRLNLSPKTVEVHLGRVYTKVGVSGRTALAGVWVAAARD